MTIAPVPHGQPNNMPESLQEAQAAVSQNLAAIDQAVQDGNIQLADELKANHQALFQRCKEEAERHGLTSKPTAEQREVSAKASQQHDQEASTSADDVQAELKQAADDLHKANEAGNEDLAHELHAKIKRLRHQAPAGGATGIHSQLSDGTELWIEIHNCRPGTTLYNAHDWDDVEGDWKSGSAGNYGYGDVCYLHMKGDFSVRCRTYWSWSDGSGRASCYWSYGSFNAGITSGHSVQDASEWNDGGSSYHTWDGGTVRFYLT
ncbi:uncharacterized protein BO95DRAFT_434487 [Aspergillus brunneoviolaceus CBS 621.78]|uniref:Uncharacterized protein n=1 Tax=Aspergillus brunneoviolaceus CBS 621.78 TaxID=1450534 RepID=A0ACD1G0S6_9EURO|nr:hypothetical protein BO95DRAFT_434487 [Aspergillus brunneoviolaceus CBS 621.78]RAH42845.1 hypothetical protein BO95DRAFT_434487 [Aspergillus brunneoviolaceus CBS 621.78]